MRDWTGLPETWSIGDDQVKKGFTRIDYFLRDLSRGIGRVQQGQVPDGSGTLISDVHLSDIYLVLLGRSGGQTAHGGTGPSQNLRFSSTTDATKGLIYWGLADLAAFDETNTRLGIGTTAATAKVHIKVAPPAFVSTVRPQGDVATASWVNTTGGTTVYPDVGGTTTATFARGIEGGAFGSYIASATATNPGTLSGWNVGFSARVLTGPPGFCALSVNMDSGGGSWFTIVNQPITTGAFQDFIFPVASASATGAVFSNLRWGMSFGASPGFGEIQVAKMRLEFPAAGGVSDDLLQKWDATTTTATLNLGDSGASTVDMKFAGNMPVHRTNGDGSSGLRTYASASSFWVEAGTSAQSAMNLVLAGNRQATATLIKANATTFEMSGLLKLDGSTSGAFSQHAAATTTNYTVTWPAAQGTANSLLQNNGSGALSWTTIATLLGVEILGGGTLQLDEAVQFFWSMSAANPALIQFFDSGTGKILQFAFPAPLTVDSFINVIEPTNGGSFPVPYTDTLVLAESAQALSNKSLYDSDLATDTQSVGTGFSDINTATKRLRLILSSAVGDNALNVGTTAARLFDLTQDFDSRITVAGNNVVAGGAGGTAGLLGKHDSTGNLVTVGATTLGNSVQAGFYRLTWYVKVTTAGDVVATDNLTISCAWNDGGAQTQTLNAENEATLLSVLPVNTLNRAFSGTKTLYAAASTNITITATLVNAGAINPAYTFRARLEALA